MQTSFSSQDLYTRAETVRQAGREVETGVQLFVLARQVIGESGFTVRQQGYVNRHGERCPNYVTGGGPGDWLCIDLYDGHKFVQRRGDFESRWHRTMMSQLPPDVRQRAAQVLGLQPPGDAPLVQGGTPPFPPPPVPPGPPVPAPPMSDAPPSMPVPSRGLAEMGDGLAPPPSSAQVGNRPVTPDPLEAGDPPAPEPGPRSQRSDLPELGDFFQE